MNFDSLILTDAEKHSLKELRTRKEMLSSEIQCFNSLRRYGFLTIAHPETVMSDGRGGYTFDEYYRLSDEYERYIKYLHSKGLHLILEAIGALKP